MIAEAAGCRIHIAHCSCPEAIEEVERARARGVDASFESCPHYFLLATEDLDAIGPKAKCSPPIRDRAHQRRMWELLGEGRIEMLVSDHSPCTFDLKASPNAFDAWGGISPVVLARFQCSQAIPFERQGRNCLGNGCRLNLH